MKAVCLISGGIDSPVAAYVMSKVGADVVLLHMDNRPFADDRSLERVKMLAEQLRKVTGKELPLYSAPHGPSQDKIAKTVDRMYQCVLCKHCMQLTAKKLAKKLGADAIIMGDSLGQVASQTLLNIRSETMFVDFPILRPLIGYDKLEIERIAQDIGTFDISIMEVSGCTILPNKVITEAKPEKAQKFYDDVSIEELTDVCAANAVRVS
ncbi:Thiamine biosynthesis ATP pyrophosphatase [Thermoplasmatales archaeon BRNA1]|nr:Thiamine biosynthesis ATP pyrophosphatase [Thermoplasmatales archaeon BRNA1]